MDHERRTQVKELVCELLELDEPEVTDTSSFVDVHEADSLMLIEILAGLEKRFNVVIAQSEVPRMVNMRGVYEVLEATPGW
ncbi:acyl carrier protein [Actinacidiphila yanglinensis]|uniref:Acyl carrier protein n=1 Tax=Actinacidiphila yanglinensis TaxID=310779 RepID=A0A1H6C6E1_9ACTN|nr:acyl carrier protein [Actinacidiphila yanglinensis]SEG68531.1 acyl carrier protein [Actinacidiphila yanglinensis]